MTVSRAKRLKISDATHRKLQERSGVLYSRALERWNRRVGV